MAAATTVELSLAPPARRLLRPQRVDRLHERSVAGWKDAGRQTDRDGHPFRQEREPPRRAHWEGGDHEREQPGEQDAESETGGATGGGEKHGFAEEEAEDLMAATAQGAEQSDLGRSLRD